MSTLDKAEIYELVGLFMLNHLGQKFSKHNIDLYRDDGMAILKRNSVRLADEIREDLHAIFKQ